MYRLLIDNKQWKDCSDEIESNVLYVAKTLSKFSRCRVDVFKVLPSQVNMIATFQYGKIQREIVA